VEVADSEGGACQADLSCPPSRGCLDKKGSLNLSIEFEWAGRSWIIESWDGEKKGDPKALQGGKE